MKAKGYEFTPIDYSKLNIMSFVKPTEKPKQKFVFHEHFQKTECFKVSF